MIGITLEEIPRAKRDGQANYRLISVPLREPFHGTYDCTEEEVKAWRSIKMNEETK